jgi:hypothetical protein
VARLPGVVPSAPAGGLLALLPKLAIFGFAFRVIGQARSQTTPSAAYLKASAHSAADGGLGRESHRALREDWE